MSQEPGSLPGRRDGGEQGERGGGIAGEREGRRAEDPGGSVYHSTVVHAVSKHLISLEIAQGAAKRKGGGRGLRAEQQRLPADAAGFKSTTCSLPKPMNLEIEIWTS